MTFESKTWLLIPTIETFAAPSTVNVSPDAQSTPNKAHISPAFTSLTSCNNTPSYPSLYTLLVRRNTVFMMFIACLGLRAQGVVSERFHSELFQKDSGLLTKFNENQHESCQGQRLNTSGDENLHC